MAIRKFFKGLQGLLKALSKPFQGQGLLKAFWKPFKDLQGLLKAL
jgi:hypothetical protein